MNDCQNEMIDVDYIKTKHVVRRFKNNQYRLTKIRGTVITMLLSWEVKIFVISRYAHIHCMYTVTSLLNYSLKIKVQTNFHLYNFIVLETIHLVF